MASDTTPILGPWLAQDLRTSLPDSFMPLVMHHGLTCWHHSRRMCRASAPWSAPVAARRLNASLVDPLPQLEPILKRGACTEWVDLAAAQTHGIQVLTGAGVSAQFVAERAIGMVIAVASA